MTCSFTREFRPVFWEVCTFYLVLFGNSEGLGRLKMLRHAPYHTSYGHKAMRGLFGI